MAIVDGRIVSPVEEPIQNIRERERYNANAKPGYAGVFVGEIIDLNDDGTVQIRASGITPEERKARLTTPVGSRNEAAGLIAPPMIGAKCICAFEHGRNTPNSAFVLTYFNPGIAGSSGQKPGDVYLSTDRGLKLALDNETNSIRLLNVNDFGLTVINDNFSLLSQSFNIKNNPNRSTVIDFNNDALIAYNAGNKMLLQQSKDFLQTVAQNYKLSVTGKKEVTVTGEYSVEAGNTIIHAVNHLSLEGSQNLSASSTRDFNTTSDGNFTTATSTIVRGSVTGNIVDYAQAGSITFGAGTVATTASANKVGIPVAASKIDLSPLGKITIKNNLSSTEHNVAGMITTNAVKYDLSATTNATIKANLIVELNAQLQVNINAKAAINIKASLGTITIDSLAKMTLKTLGIMDVNATGIFQVSSIGMKLNPALPVLGVKTITLFGPQPLLPL